MRRALTGSEAAFCSVNWYSFTPDKHQFQAGDPQVCEITAATTASGSPKAVVKLVDLRSAANNFTILKFIKDICRSLRYWST